LDELKPAPLAETIDGGSIDDQADDQATLHLVDRDVAVIDYEGSNYRTDFWGGPEREYEDAVERLVLQRLVPPSGLRVAEIGAGFGRLASLYRGYQQVILFDYSRSLLQEARERWGDDPRFVFVAGDIYKLPLASNILDTLVMVRVMHHLADVPLALTQLARTLHMESCAVLEFANKRHIKSVIRWLTRRQSWSPFAEAPVEFVELNYDFHPNWMKARLTDAGFRCKQRVAVSHFRLPLLKRLVNAHWLARIDNGIATVAGWRPYAPSVFVQASVSTGTKQKSVAVGPASIPHLFRCPGCLAEAFEQDDSERIRCAACGQRYARNDGIWDFKK